MKPFPSLLFAWLILLTSAAPAAPKAEKPFTLTTESGKVYHKVQVMAVDPDGLRIIHAEGAAKIAFEQLDAELQAKYHFDSEKAAAFRAEMEKQLKAETEANQKLKAEAEEERAHASFNEFRKSLLNSLQQLNYNYAELDSEIVGRIQQYRENSHEEWARVLEGDRELLKQRESQRASLENNERAKELEKQNAKLQDQINQLQAAVNQTRTDDYRPTKRVTYYSSPFPYTYYYNQPFYYSPPIYIRPPQQSPCPPLRPVPSPTPVPHRR
jgi:hypothetical protein